MYNIPFDPKFYFWVYSAKKFPPWSMSENVHCNPVVGCRSTRVPSLEERVGNCLGCAPQCSAAAGNSGLGITTETGMGVENIKAEKKT